MTGWAIALSVRSKERNLKGDFAMSIKSVLVFFAAITEAIAVADPQITSCTVTQDSATHLVKATYSLAEPAVITFDVKTNGVSIGGANLTHAYGDVHRVVDAGSGTLYWQADKSWPGHKLSSASFEVVAWATNSPPDYMVVDLVVKKGARTYYIAPEQLPDGGVTNKKYKTDYLVMRRIPAKDAIFPMGYLSPSNPYQYCLYHRVKLTNDFYMAVYEMTLGQCKNAIGAAPSDLASYYCSSYFKDQPGFAGYTNNLANPMPQTPYYAFRGYSGSLWGVNQDHTIADTSCILYKMRTLLGLSSLDLPTDAEWEFASRAGTAADRYDGSWSSQNPTNMAWIADNSTLFTLWGVKWYLPHEVGLLRPNAFGLYDMLGNVREMCLDLYNEGSAYAGDVVINDSNAEPIVAPTGPDKDILDNSDGLSCGSYSSYSLASLWGGDPNSTRRVARGGGVNDDKWNTCSYYRAPIGSSKCYPACADYTQDGRGPYGYRLVCLP